MQTQQQSRPNDHSREKREKPKKFSRNLLIVLTILLAAFAVSVVLTLNGLNVLTGPWTSILLALIAVLGAVLAIFQAFPSLLWVFPPRDSSPSSSLTVEVCEYPPLRAIRSSPNSVFPFLETLANVQEVYGWGPLRRELLDCVQQGRPASIVGLRRIGKTWLLDYVRLVIAVEQRLGANYRVSYVDATSAECSTVRDFTTSVLEQLGVCVSPENVPLNLKVLSKAIRELRQHQIVPALCLDEFEGFSHHPQEFTRDFYTELRSLSKEGLGLVVASQRPLLDIVNEETRTSPFFNIFQQFSLKPFDAQDAEAFAEAKSKQAVFSKQERAYLLKYGTKDGYQWPPIRLQLVGKLIFDAKKAAAREGPRYYRPDDPDYWRAFEKSLEDMYEAVVVS